MLIIHITLICLVNMGTRSYFILIREVNGGCRSEFIKPYEFAWFGMGGYLELGFVDISFDVYPKLE